MLTVHVTSSKTKEEIDKCFENDNFYEDLKEALNEALDYADSIARDKATVRTRCVPDIDVYALHEKLGMTQNRFAHMPGVPRKRLKRGNPGRKRLPGPRRISCSF